MPDDKCCKDVPEGQACLADSDDIEDDPDVNSRVHIAESIQYYIKDCLQQISGCEKWNRNVDPSNAPSERAMPFEMGLYLDFNVTDDGIPFGCPGLDNFTPTMFNESRTNTITCIIIS